MEPKYFFAKIKQINEDRTIDAVASTVDIDRDNEVILPSAFTQTLDAFKANPVVLAGHQHRLPSGSSPVIGSIYPDSIIISETDVSFKMRFASTDLGEEYWQLYYDKHMRAFSIGFIPLQAEYQKMKGKKEPVFVHTKIELLEVSAVPVPSNRRALARAKGYFDAEETKNALVQAILDVWQKEFMELQKHIVVLTDEIKRDIPLVLSAVEDVKSLLITDSDRFAEELLLGSSSEPSVPAGDKINAEQYVKAVKNVTQKINLGKDNSHG